MAAQWRSVTFSLSGCRTSKPASTNSLQRSKMPYLWMSDGEAWKSTETNTHWLRSKPGHRDKMHTDAETDKWKRKTRTRRPHRRYLAPSLKQILQASIKAAQICWCPLTTSRTVFRSYENYSPLRPTSPYPFLSHLINSTVCAEKENHSCKYGATRFKILRILVNVLSVCRTASQELQSKLQIWANRKFFEHFEN